MDKPVTQYIIKLQAGKKNLVNYLEEVIIYSSKDKPLQFIKLLLTLNREQYNSYVLPYKDDILLEILSAKGVSSDDKPPDIDVSFSYHLTILEESISEDQITISENIDANSPYILICAHKNQLKQYQKIIKDKIFFEETREGILNTILANSNFELQTNIFKKNEIIDQFFLPPLRQYHSILYINSFLKLFDAPNPIFINYSLDGKIYLGSCIKNNYTPLKIFYASDNDSSEKAILVSSKKKIYDYIINSAIQESRSYNTLCLSLGKKQNFIFYPMNKLVSKLNKEINSYNDKLFLNNILGSDSNIANHIKNTLEKETWFKDHNGFPNIENDEDNLHLIENFISHYINQSIVLKMNIESQIKFEDFLLIGRKITLNSGINAIKYNGDYYLDSSIIHFKSAGPYWTGHAYITAKSGFKTTEI